MRSSIIKYQHVKNLTLTPQENAPQKTSNDVLSNNKRNHNKNLKIIPKRLITHIHRYRQANINRIISIQHPHPLKKQALKINLSP